MSDSETAFDVIYAELENRISDISKFLNKGLTEEEAHRFSFGFPNSLISTDLAKLYWERANHGGNHNNWDLLTEDEQLVLRTAADFAHQIQSIQPTPPVEINYCTTQGLSKVFFIIFLIIVGLPITLSMLY